MSRFVTRDGAVEQIGGPLELYDSDPARRRGRRSARRSCWVSGRGTWGSDHPRSPLNSSSNRPGTKRKWPPGSAGRTSYACSASGSAAARGKTSHCPGRRPAALLRRWIGLGHRRRV